MHQIPGFVVMSDSHIGDGSLRDDFQRSDEQRLESEINDLQDQVDDGWRVILAGDIWDGWRYDLKQCFDAHRSSLVLLMSLRPIVLIGNHDEDLAGAAFKTELIKLGARCVVPQYLMLGPGGQSVYCCHGQEFDQFNSKSEWVGKSLIKAISAIGSISSTAEDWLSKYGGQAEGWLSRSGRHTDQDAFTDRVMKSLEETPITIRGQRTHNVTVCGHTHAAKSVCRPDLFTLDPLQPPLQYINTGTWLQTGWNFMSWNVPDAPTDKCTTLQCRHWRQ